MTSHLLKCEGAPRTMLENLTDLEILKVYAVTFDEYIILLPSEEMK